MKRKFNYIEQRFLLDGEPGVEGGGTEAAPSETAAPAESAQPAAIDYNSPDFQKAVSSVAESQFEALKSQDPAYQQFAQYQEFLNSQKNQNANPFQNGVNTLGDVQAYSQYMNDRSKQAEETIAQQNDRIGYLESIANNKMVDEQVTTINEVFQGLLGTEEDTQNFFSDVISNNAELSELWNKAGQDPYTAGQDFFNKLTDTAVYTMFHQLSDPNSTLLDSLVENKIRQKELAKNSMMGTDIPNSSSGASQGNPLDAQII